MNVIVGDDGNQRLFGTDGRDQIFGRGGRDEIFGNGGRDDITGNGPVQAGDGNDRYHFFYYERFLEPTVDVQIIASMGNGADEVVLGSHFGQGGTLPGVRADDLDLGGGPDRFYMTGSTSQFFATDLGEGKDRAYIMSEGGASVHLGSDPIFTSSSDGKRDTVHFDGNGEELEVNLFGAEDRLIIYDIDISLEDLALRSFVNSQGYLEMTLPNDSVIKLGGDMTVDRLLNDGQVRLEADALTLTKQIYVGGAEVSSKVTLGSGADEVIRSVLGRDAYLGAGDDLGIGNGRANVIHGEAGDDAIQGRKGADTIEGGTGHDTLKGGPGRDAIVGGLGDNVIHGNAGRDTIYSISHNDQIKGGSGRDTIHLVDNRGSVFGEQPDYRDVWGGSGADTFVLYGSRSHYLTAIHDFTPGVDKLDIRNLDLFDPERLPESFYEIEPGDMAFRDVPGTLFYDAGYLILAGLKPGDLTLDDLIY